MAERKQVNKYYPPDFDPRKHKNLDKYHNSHALRERAKKIDQGILVIRFEMPYDIWCEGCKIHIAMGVRYNAEKRKVGYYYSTPIYRFRMKCHLCENYFEIETDPKNVNYKIIIGAQRKNEKWDMAENEQVLTEDRQVVKKLASDAMFKLEHGVEDKKKLQKAAPTLSDIVDIQSGWQDDYMQNRMLRAKFRKEKKELKEEELKDRALLEKSSLDIALVPETEEDRKLASLLKYEAVESFDEKQRKKRTELQSQSIFAASTLMSASSSSNTPSSEVTPSKLDKLNRQLQMVKKPNPGGFGIFDSSGVKRKKTAAVSGVVVKRKRSDGGGEAAAGSDGHSDRAESTIVSSSVDHMKVTTDVEKGDRSVTEESGENISGERRDGQAVDVGNQWEMREDHVPCSTNGPTCYQQTFTGDGTSEIIVSTGNRNMEPEGSTRCDTRVASGAPVYATSPGKEDGHVKKEKPNDSPRDRDNGQQECSRTSAINSEESGGIKKGALSGTSHHQVQKHKRVSLVGDYSNSSSDSE